MKLPSMDSFMAEQISERGASMFKVIKQVHDYVKTCKREYKDARSSLEKTWLELFAEYMSTAEGQEYIRQSNSPSDPSNPAGATKLDWRHHVSTGKAAEIVEAFVNYWRNAAFPSKTNWFELVPSTPLIEAEADYEARTAYRKFLRVMKAYFNLKFEQGKFESKFVEFLRQAAIIGNSCIALPWRYEVKSVTKNRMVESGDGVKFERYQQERVLYNNASFEVLDMFDVFLDPNGDDMNTANMVRVCRKSKAELIRQIRSGFYDLADEEDIKKMNTSANKKSDEAITLNEIQGISPRTSRTQDFIEVYEFWGTVLTDDYEFTDVVVTCTDDTILRFEQNPYWAGRPFVFARVIPISNSVYGCSPLQFVQGGLVTLNKLTNQRLDAIDYTLEPTLLVEEDAVQNIQDVYIQSGRTIPVRNVNAVKQLDLSLNTAPSITEQQLLETSVDKTAGAGSLITAGVNSFGNRERVTSVEVNAQRDAGGLRVSGMYAEIETYALMPLLKKLVDYFNQFQTLDETFPIAGTNPAETYFATVGPRELSLGLEIYPRSATYVVQKEAQIQNTQLFIQAAAGLQQFSELTNWEKLYDDMVELLLNKEPEEYKVKKEEAPATPDPMAAMQQLDPTTSSNVPVDIRNMLAGQQMADGGAGAMRALRSDVQGGALAEDSLAAAAEVQGLQ